MKNFLKEQEVYIHGQVKIGNDFVMVDSRGAIVDPKPGEKYALCYIENIGGTDEILDVHKRFLTDASQKHRKETHYRNRTIEKEIATEMQQY